MASKPDNDGYYWVKVPWDRENEEIIAEFSGGHWHFTGESESLHYTENSAPTKWRAAR